MLPIRIANSKGYRLTGKSYWSGHFFAAAGGALPSGDNFESEDQFEEYDLTTFVDVELNLGKGLWAAGWVYAGLPVGIRATDDMESYTLEDPVTATLNGGDGSWGGAWVYAAL